MIYDVESLCWWRFVLPLDDGQLNIRKYKHCVRDWWVVWDPFHKPHVYWEERERREYSYTPPWRDKEASVQTDDTPCTLQPAQIPTLTFKTTGVQTDYEGEGDIWDVLRQSVHGLSVADQHKVFERLERFLSMGLLHP